MTRSSLLSIGVLLFSFGTFPSAVNASPELAQAWQKQAGDLKARVENSTSFKSGDPLVSDLERFGRIAGKLANAGTAAHPLPTDLGCIFRGMEEETRVQLSILETDHSVDEKSSAKERLVLMLADAVIVGKAAILELNGDVSTVPKSDDHPRSCQSADLKSVK